MAPVSAVIFDPLAACFYFVPSPKAPSNASVRFSHPSIRRVNREQKPGSNNCICVQCRACMWLDESLVKTRHRANPTFTLCRMEKSYSTVVEEST
ncbi:hypothetical protein PIB30_029916 [Stylosanthes scabra]|uniref:Secreted protein n=1 Tax=Stylosanthes scabra TaxID=79078 RepID=A0ABU6TDJ7_9FABA|nr:hypothetical protein [Stylosanthes scabra]